MLEIPKFNFEEGRHTFLDDDLGTALALKILEEEGYIKIERVARQGRFVTYHFSRGPKSKKQPNKN